MRSFLPIVLAAALCVSPARAEKAKTSRLGFREQHDLARLPGVIDGLTAERQKLEKLLADGSLYARDPAKFAAATDRLDALAVELAEAEDRWLELEMKRDELA